MALYYDKITDTVEVDLGIEFPGDHPNPVVTEAGDPVIDRPVLDVGGGRTAKIQCKLEGSPHSQLEVESVLHETERETEKTTHSRGCEMSINMIKFRASSKVVEVIFMCGGTLGACAAVQQKAIISNLIPASVYKMQITQFTGLIQEWEVEQFISTKAPFGPPVDFCVTKNGEGKFSCAWEKPVLEPDCTIDFYDISIKIYQQSGLHDYKRHRVEGEHLYAQISLEKESSYVFEIQAGCKDFMSKPSKKLWTMLKHEIVHDGNMVNHVGKPTYLVGATTMEERGNIPLKEVGKKTFREVAMIEKVILILGQTGAGKTTWINSMLNYLLDVKYTDNFRFKLVIEENAEHQELSQTQITTVYKIHYKKGYNIAYTLNLIDTPGFGDTGGIERDMGIAKQLQMIFDVQKGFVDHLDAVVFVTKANHQRLDPCQKYILSSITELFGADIAEHIYLVFTHAGIEKPAMLDTLQGTELKDKSYFMFDNAAVFSNIEKIADKTGNKTQLRLLSLKEETRGSLYEIAMDNFKQFLQKVQSSPGTGLSATRDVLKKRMLLRKNISDLNSLVRQGLDEMDQLKSVVMATAKRDGGVKQTKDYVVINEEMVKVKVKKSGFRGTTVCIDCKYTCHKDCLVLFDFMKSICKVMNRNTSPHTCKVCPHNCPWNYHRNLKYIYEDQLKKVQETLFAHKKRYEEAQGKKLTADEVCKNIKIELKAMEAKMKANLSEITDSIQKLHKIGMKSDESSLMNYIDILIEREKQDASTKQKNKLDILYDLRRQATDIIDIEKGEYDPFKEYREKATELSLITPDIKELDLWTKVANSITQATKQTVMSKTVNYFRDSIIQGDKVWPPSKCNVSRCYHDVIRID